MTKERLASLMRDVFTDEVVPLLTDKFALGRVSLIWAEAMTARDDIAGFLRTNSGRKATVYETLSGFIAGLFALRYMIDKEEGETPRSSTDVFENEIMALREAGQKEYAHDVNNAFANFERASADLGIDRKQILWVFAMKHRDGVQSYLDGHRSQRENVRGRINDLIVYSLILRGMVEEEIVQG
jgi:hypothetical protein